MSARLRAGSLRFDVAGACMKPALVLLLVRGRLVPLVPPHRGYRDDMGIHGNQ